MMTLALGPSWLDPNHLLNTFGIWGLLLVVFAESGLLIGFFLPGDSLLFTCGLLITSHQMHFPLAGAIALICVAAILGDQVGYMFGKKVGPSLFNRPDSRLFKQENVTKAHEFFEKYGPKSLVLARFVPVVRTFTPIIAGVSGMKYRSFLIFNVIGGVLWGAGVTLLGSWLGNVPFVKNNIEAILILIVLVSVVPIAIEFLRARSKARKAPADAPAPQQPPFGPQPPFGQQPPVMDDATTRLRAVPPAHQDRAHAHSLPNQAYGHPNQAYGGQNQAYGDQNQAYGDQNQAYGDQSHGGQGQQPYGTNQGGYDEHYGRTQQPYAQQYPQGYQQPHPQQQPYGSGQGYAQPHPQAQPQHPQQPHPYGQGYPQD
ncbi:DedA family protein [Streptomyces glomeratus]|uniref:VTT domain-containing protein n=1 Tax=Streptomyces glomeratus TaxID=284452 RepID=A0ABP6LGQ8_9ACTN|nr:VTT domain-containing protein [Streptomyces glomeratus]MCF1506486.1 VTT domain-containing protein [Streptomyces glomeratus]